jgi:hypothetical protein
MQSRWASSSTRINSRSSRVPLSPTSTARRSKPALAAPFHAAFPVFEPDHAVAQEENTRPPVQAYVWFRLLTKPLIDTNHFQRPYATPAFSTHRREGKRSALSGRLVMLVSADGQCRRVAAHTMMLGLFHLFLESAYLRHRLTKGARQIFKGRAKQPAYKAPNQPVDFMQHLTPPAPA